MKLYFMEVRKICSRKIVWTGIIVMMAFLFFQFWAVAVDDIRIYEQGEWIEGIDAIERNKEIAREYEGLLSLEKAEAIIEKYGFSYFDETTDYETGNYSSRYITHIMTDLRVTGERPEEFVKDEDGSYRGEFDLRQGIIFGYAEGWENLRESMMAYMMMLSVLLIIIVAPVFTEEYSLRTVDVALTTQHGRRRDIWMKIGAAAGVSAFIYLIAVGGMYALYLCVYGTDGLTASAYMLAPMRGFGEVMIWEFFLGYFFGGLTAVLLNTCITLVISAAFKQGFITIIVSLTTYFLPYVLAEIIMASFPVNQITFILRNIFTWFPFWLAHCQQLGTVPWLYAWRMVFVAGMFVASIVIAYRRYRD